MGCESNSRSSKDIIVPSPFIPTGFELTSLHLEGDKCLIVPDSSRYNVYRKLADEISGYNEKRMLLIEAQVDSIRIHDAVLADSLEKVLLIYRR